MARIKAPPAKASPAKARLVVSPATINAATLYAASIEISQKIIALSWRRPKLAPARALIDPHPAVPALCHPQDCDIRWRALQSSFVEQRGVLRDREPWFPGSLSALDLAGRDALL